MRKKHSSKFKFKVAMLAIKGDQTIQEICHANEVAPSMVHKWKKKLIDSGEQVFNGNKKANHEREALDKRIQKLHEKVGQLTMERDYLKKTWQVLNGETD